MALARNLRARARVYVAAEVRASEAVGVTPEEGGAAVSRRRCERRCGRGTIPQTETSAMPNDATAETSHRFAEYGRNTLPWTMSKRIQGRNRRTLSSSCLRFEHLEQYETYGAGANRKECNCLERPRPSRRRRLAPTSRSHAPTMATSSPSQFWCFSSIGANGKKSGSIMVSGCTPGAGRLCFVSIRSVAVGRYRSIGYHRNR